MPHRTQCECGRMVNPTRHGYAKCSRCRVTRGSKYKTCDGDHPKCIGRAAKGYTKCHVCRANRQPKRSCATEGCDGRTYKHDHCGRCREAPVMNGIRPPKKRNNQWAEGRFGGTAREHPNYRLKRVPLVLCDEPGCATFVESEGLCRAHRGRSPWQRRIGTMCPAHGCRERIDEGDYLCSFHRRSWDLFGSIWRVASVLTAEGRECSFDGCDRAQDSKGLCHAHYLQLRAGKRLSPIGSSRVGRPPKEGRKPVESARRRVHECRSPRVDPNNVAIRTSDRQRVESFRYEREGTLCDACGEKEGKEVDHVQEIADVGAVALGAPLRWLCKGCHRAKTRAMAIARRGRSRDAQMSLNLRAPQGGLNC